MEIIKEWLCKIGLHNWHYFHCKCNYGLRECKRCGKLNNYIYGFDYPEGE